MATQNKKNLDFELNLLPIISILAVCISFLLLTTVWVQIGTLNVSQAFGTESAKNEKTNPPSLWIELQNDGGAVIKLNEGDTLKSRLMVKGASGSRVNLGRVEQSIAQIKSARPELNVALILPAPDSSYDDLIALMSRVKKHDIRDIGVAPL